MASIADLLTADQRERIIKRLDELAELARLAREPPEPPDPDGDGQDYDTAQAPRTATSRRSGVTQPRPPAG